MKTFEAAYDANPHGAGLAYIDEHQRVVHDKGYMSKSAFMQVIKEYKFTKEDEVAFHFRWATSGGINRGACHPFPISASHDKLKKCFNMGDKVVLFHNGMFNLTPKDGLSDTMTLATRLSKTGLKKDGHQAIERVRSGSRVLLFKGDGEHIRMGEWHERSGVLYSNLNFQSKMIDPIARIRSNKEKLRRLSNLAYQKRLDAADRVIRKAQQARERRQDKDDALRQLTLGYNKPANDFAKDAIHRTRFGKSSRRW
jgi:hypothetical protein